MAHPADHHEHQTSRPLVVVAGALPPPVHGQSLMTDAMARALETRPCRVVRCDTTPPRMGQGGIYALRRIRRVLWTALRLLALAPTARQRLLYVAAAGGWGNLYKSFLTGVGRCLGYRIAIAHHSFAYLDRRDPIFALLTRCAGPDALHIALCPRMAARLRSAYDGVTKTRVLPNTALIPPASRPQPRQQPFTLGHVGLLGWDKGLDLVLETVTALHEQGMDVRLLLAGSADAQAQAAIADAQARLDSVIEYHGVVGGLEKEQLFARLDAFVLPSRYRNEAQPCVLFEAMAHGTPVIATARGCIPDDVTDDLGLVISRIETFVPQAVKTIHGWQADPTAFYQLRCHIWAKTQTRQMADRLIGEDLMDLLLSPDPWAAT